MRHMLIINFQSISYNTYLHLSDICLIIREDLYKYIVSDPNYAVSVARPPNATNTPKQRKFLTAQITARDQDGSRQDGSRQDGSRQDRSHLLPTRMVFFQSNTYDYISQPADIYSSIAQCTVSYQPIS